VTEVGEMMEWQYVMEVSVIGSRNWLPFAKDIRILIVNKLAHSQGYKLYGMCCCGGCVVPDIPWDHDAVFFRDCLTCRDEVT
jgi:hypothetical protein